MMQTGFFDWHERFENLNKNGDPLVKLNQVVDREIFRKPLEKIRDKERKSNAGAKPYDVVRMFKILVIQSLYNLSDDRIGFQIPDRISFMRFPDLGLGDRVPDARTIWLFREQITAAGLIKPLFEQFDACLRENGFPAQKGQIIDAGIEAAPRQRNSREENRRIKQGDIPGEWDEARRRRKDTDARWTKKNGQNYYGYKNHIPACAGRCVDIKHKLIRDYDITDAAVHDSQVFDQLLDESNSSRDVYADSAYRSEESLDRLRKCGFREHLQRKGCRHRKLTESEQRGNRTRARKRSRVEHVFGVQAMMAGKMILRTIGIIRARAKIGLMNLAYNINRYSMLEETG